MPLLHTSDLTGPALDFAVAQALKLPIIEERADVVWDGEPPQWLVDLLGLELGGGRYDTPAWSPSTDVSLGMPLVWRARIATFADGENWCAAAPGQAYNPDVGYIDTNWEECSRGDTPLIAGCRALVALLLGDTVEIPTSLAET